MGNISYKCPECGAPINWVAEANCFRCMYCDGEYQASEIEGVNTDSLQKEEEIQHAEEISEDEAEFAESSDGTIGNDLVKYKCSHCFAELITERATAASICVYCGNPIVMTEQIVGDFTPKYVIPFEKTKEEAMQKFSKFMDKPLTPKDFKASVSVDKVQGIYIPFWLFSGKFNAEASFTCKKLTYEKNFDKENDDKIYRTWDVFKVQRKGYIPFKNITADASSKTEDIAMQSIEPYNYDKMIDFNPAYLSGYLAERYDENADEQKEKIADRIVNTGHDKLIDTCSSYNRIEEEDFKHEIQYDDVEYALLPTWLLYCTYKNKKYLFAMNGQTGKFIGNLPIDIKKALGIAAGIFIVLAILCWGILPNIM